MRHRTGDKGDWVCALHYALEEAEANQLPCYCRGLDNLPISFLSPFELPYTIIIQGIWNHNVGNYLSPEPYYHIVVYIFFSP